MAKDFNKLAEDNPVMAILGKAEEEKAKQKNANSILSSMADNSNTVQETKVETAAAVQEQTTSSTETTVESKKILMNINLRESTKKQWKMFFLEHDLTMTQGIETAVEYLMSEVNKGNIRLTKGGITK